MTAPANTKLRVIAYTKTSEIGPSSRYRYHQMAPYLDALGVELQFRPLFGPAWFAILRRGRFVGGVLKCVYAPLRLLVRLWALLTMGRPDLVVIEHQLFPYLPAWYERWLRFRRQPFTVEFDDAIFLTRLHRAKMETLCTLASRVIVGNRELSSFAERFSRKVTIVPTTIEMARYPVATTGSAGPVGTDRPFVIGWIGLPYNFESLQLVREPLTRLAAERSIVLRVLSDGAPDLPGVPVEVVPWTAEAEADEIEGFDVGIMPLPDTEWSRGKCALKILQYFAAGRPAIASPVGANTDVVRSGENGFLAGDNEEWYRSLDRLAQDPALSVQMGKQARHDVEREYAASAWAPRLAAAWRRASTDGAPVAARFPEDRHPGGGRR